MPAQGFAIAKDQPIDVLPDSEAAQSARPLVEVIYYTDPLCSWSWAFEPQWRRLRYEFGHQLSWRYAMGGLISDWRQFSDPINDISRPTQMAPQWIQVRQLAGMPIDERIWVEDPPGSSYPACIAVKAAERQGAIAGEAYLRRLREAVMVERRNIAHQEVLLALAEELAVPAGSGFNAQQFHGDLASQAVIDAFREDLKEGRYREIGRFPTLIFRAATGKALLITGYRPYQVLCNAIAELAPESCPLRSATDAIAYATYWGGVTTTEVAVALNSDLDQAERLLNDAVAEGALGKVGQIYDRLSIPPV